MLDRGDLGSSGDGAGGEGGVDQRRPSDAGAQPTRHGADEVDQAGMVLDRTQGGDRDGAVLAHPTEIIADEVDDHHVLSPVLLGQLLFGRGRSLDGRGPDAVVPTTQEELG